MEGAVRSVQAVVADPGNQAFTVEELQLSGPRRHEVVVRMVAVGLCHTDLIFRDSATEARVLGHEGAGIIEDIGPDVDGFAPGDKVLLSFNYCAICRNCREGKPSLCESFATLNYTGRRPDGSTTFSRSSGEVVGGSFFGQSSFSSYAVVSENTIVKLDESTTEDDLRVLAPLGCSGQTGAGAVINSLRLTAGSSLVVFGAGGVGLSAVMAARLSGASEIVVVDKNVARLKMARTLGATYTLCGDPSELKERIRSYLGGGADYALETTGHGPLARLSAEILGAGGMTGLIGVGRGEVAFDHIQLLSGVTVKGIIEGDAVPQSFIPSLVRAYRAGQFPINSFLTMFPLSGIEDAVEQSRCGTVIKAVLTF